MACIDQSYRPQYSAGRLHSAVSRCQPNASAFCYFQPNASAQPNHSAAICILKTSVVPQAGEHFPELENWSWWENLSGWICFGTGWIYFGIICKQGVSNLKIHYSFYCIMSAWRFRPLHATLHCAVLYLHALP